MKTAPVDEVKLCSTCHHAKQAGQMWFCFHHLNVFKSLVDGQTRTMTSPDHLRGHEDKCGQSAKWWKAK